MSPITTASGEILLPVLSYIKLSLVLETPFGPLYRSGNTFYTAHPHHVVGYIKERTREQEDFFSTLQAIQLYQDIEAHGIKQINN